MIAFTCLQCRQPLHVPDEAAGKPVRCPRCGQVATIQAAAAVPRTLTSPGSGKGAPAAMQPSAPLTPQQTPAATNGPRTDGIRANPAGSTVPQAPPAAIPVAGVPGYAILGELGRGGMGVVYKAKHLKLKRLVALKMILSGAHAGEHELTRFRLEAEALARLQHPNIVQ